MCMHMCDTIKVQEWMTIAIYNNNIIIIIPISLLFFASACLLAVEMRLSISELVMLDTVA